MACFRHLCFPLVYFSMVCGVCQVSKKRRYQKSASGAFLRDWGLGTRDWGCCLGAGDVSGFSLAVSARFAGVAVFLSGPVCLPGGVVSPRSAPKQQSPIPIPQSLVPSPLFKRKGVAVFASVDL